MKLLIEIGKVPIGSKITKRTGEKIYEVRDKILIYGGENCNHPELKVSPGTKLIVTSDARYSFAVEVVPDTLEIVWEVSEDRLRQYLDDMEDHQ